VVVAVVFIDLVGFGIVIPVLAFYVRSFAVSSLVYLPVFVILLGVLTRAGSTTTARG
jgi:hypothetical protein